MAQIETNFEAIGDAITAGLAQKLQAIVKAKLLANIDETVSEIAREIALNTVANAKSMMFHGAFNLAPEIRIVLNFNNKEVQYKNLQDQASKERPAPPAGTVRRECDR